MLKYEFLLTCIASQQRLRPYISPIVFVYIEKEARFSSLFLQDEIKLYAKILGNYSGDLTEIYKKYIPKHYYETVKEKSMEKYLEFTNKDANNDIFEIPDYKIIKNHLQY